MDALWFCCNEIWWFQFILFEDRYPWNVTSFACLCWIYQIPLICFFASFSQFHICGHILVIEFLVLKLFLNFFLELNIFNNIKLYTMQIENMDALFEAQFSPLSESGRFLSKCGKCSRYMKYISAQPSRIYCNTCEEVYYVPQRGTIKVIDISMISLPWLILGSSWCYILNSD